VFPQAHKAFSIEQVQYAPMCEVLDARGFPALSKLVPHACEHPMIVMQVQMQWMI
jgi:hypothetical protein